METEQEATFGTPPPPPPPPPPREIDEASETLVKAEDEEESMEDIEPHSVDAIGTSLSLSDLKRKREELGEDVVMDEEFTESMAKKVKEQESVLSPKINGIHKSEDRKMADVTETGMNGIMAKTGF
jgi:hypothetical protein